MLENAELEQETEQETEAETVTDDFEEKVTAEVNKRLAEQEKERKKQEQEAMKQAGETEKLLGQLEKRVSELEPVEEKAARYEAALATYAEKLKKGLDDSVLELVNRLDLAQQVEWLSKHKPEEKKAIPASPQRKGGEMAKPKDTEKDDVARKNLKKTVRKVW